MLWKPLTDKYARESNNSNQTGSNDDIEGIDNFKERELNESPSSFLTVKCNADGPNISPSEMVNIAPGESQISVSFSSEPNMEALTFPKGYSAERRCFNEKREVLITKSKYVHARLKCCDDRFAANPQYIFHALV